MAERSDESEARRGYRIRGQSFAAPPLEPGLYVVATPIGNLGDVTIRALDTLAGADLLACEDTRVTKRLLDRYGIDAKVTAYHEHSGAGRASAAARRARRGQVGGARLRCRHAARLRSGRRARRRCDRRRAIASCRSPARPSLAAALSAAGLPTDEVPVPRLPAVEDGARESA